MTQESRMTDNTPMSKQQITIIYAVCHATSMASACANPIIYGFLNENFHREFTELYKKAKNAFSCLCKISTTTAGSSPGANGGPRNSPGANGDGPRGIEIDNNGDAHSIEATPLVVMSKKNVANGATTTAPEGSNNLIANNGHQ